jgi:hypothetical protein
MLTEWANFYVITGSAAAALTGLMFVVIALAANGRRGMGAHGLRAFVTPTIVHFGTVLALSAFLSVPRQTATSLAMGLGAAGVVGLAYSALITVSMRRIGRVYVPVAEDWIWHVILPTITYAGLLVLAFLMRRRMQPCLYGIAALSVGLLFIGIHNAWDVAVSISTQLQEARKSAEPSG